MRLCERPIGVDLPPYIIAEIGVNHDGSVERALELTEAAAGAGADAVKLQLFRTDLLMSRAAKLAAYQARAGETDPVAMLRRLELPIGSMARVAERAHALGLDAIVTVFSVELVAEAEGIGELGGAGWDSYKTASPDIINRPLIEAVARTGRPLLVSTGAATVEEVDRALDWVEEASEEARTGPIRCGVLHCVSAYPTPDEDAALGGIIGLYTGLRNAERVAPGYSDHTAALDTGALAVMSGAQILEKHLTYDRGAKGPDHAASLDPGGFAQYAAAARRAYRMMGPREKRVLAIEADVRRASRQSVTTVRAMRAGETIGRGDVTVKRPGTGIEPFRLGEVVGRALARDVEGDMPVVEGDLA